VSLKDVMTISSIACQIRSAFVLQKNQNNNNNNIYLFFENFDEYMVLFYFILNFLISKFWLFLLKSLAKLVELTYAFFYKNLIPNFPHFLVGNFDKTCCLKKKTLNGFRSCPQVICRMCLFLAKIIALNICVYGKNHILQFVFTIVEYLGSFNNNHVRYIL